MIMKIKPTNEKKKENKFYLDFVVSFLIILFANKILGIISLYNTKRIEDLLTDGTSEKEDMERIKKYKRRNKVITSIAVFIFGFKMLLFVSFLIGFVLTFNDFMNSNLTL